MRSSFKQSANLMSLRTFLAPIVLVPEQFTGVRVSLRVSAAPLGDRQQRLSLAFKKRLCASGVLLSN